MDLVYEWQEANRMKPAQRLSFKQYLELLGDVAKAATTHDRHAYCPACGSTVRHGEGFICGCDPEWLR